MSTRAAAYRRWVLTFTWAVAVLGVAYVSVVTALTLDGEASAVHHSPFFYVVGWILVVGAVADVVWWAVILNARLQSDWGRGAGGDGPAPDPRRPLGTLYEGRARAHHPVPELVAALTEQTAVLGTKSRSRTAVRSVPRTADLPRPTATSPAAIMDDDTAAVLDAHEAMWQAGVEEGERRAEERKRREGEQSGGRD